MRNESKVDQTKEKRARRKSKEDSERECTCNNERTVKYGEVKSGEVKRNKSRKKNNACCDLRCRREASRCPAQLVDGRQCGGASCRPL